MEITFNITKEQREILIRAIKGAGERASHDSQVNGEGSYTTLSWNVFKVGENTFFYKGRRGGFVNGALQETGLDLQNLLQDSVIVSYKTSQPNWGPFETQLSRATDAEKVLIVQSRCGAEPHSSGRGVIAAPYPWEWTSEWGAVASTGFRGVWTTYTFPDGSKLDFDGRVLLILD